MSKSSQWAYEENLKEQEKLLDNVECPPEILKRANALGKKMDIKNKKTNFQICLFV
jgi:hypothetical protein